MKLLKVGFNLRLRNSAMHSLMCFLFSILSITAIPNSSEKLLKDLELEIKQREIYQQKKVERIRFLNTELNNAEKDQNKRLAYDLNRRLYEEYQSFIYDSAFRYVSKMIMLSREINDPELLARAKIEMGFTLLSSGLFKESLDTLLSINRNNLSNRILADYLSVLARTYYDLGDYDNDAYYSGIYIRKGNQCLGEAISLVSDTTSKYWLMVGLKRMKSDDFQGAAEAFNFVISHFPISSHDFAISTSSLGWIYQLLDRNSDAMDMLIKAAIADIQTSTRETVALRNLAVILYERGELDMAYRYIKIALDDATFYNARHRKMEIGEVLPIIEGKILAALEKQRKQLLNYALITSILSLLVTAFALVIFLQLKRLKTIRKILQETNKNLQTMNETLLEANKIKEEYIGYFFNINSEFIDRIEAFQKTIRRKIAAQQFDDLNYIIKSGDINRERENLYMNFDKIFLKIFPHFIEEFNKLFSPEDRILPETGELMNADLRIYALIRLGISDNDKIAKFLNYSVNTIYTYKTKLKHKTIVPRDSFEDFIMAIKAI